MQTVEAFGIVHEDCLYELKVIPKSVYDSMCRLRTQLSHFESALGSILPYWLGVGHAGEEQRLADILNEFKKQPPQAPQQRAAAAGVKEQEDEDEESAGEDDQWDAEDINEILSMSNYTKFNFYRRLY